MPREEEGWEAISLQDIDLGPKLGGGAMGVIYKGHFRGQEVALKTLFDARISPEVEKEFMDELMVMSRLSHSNIVNFLGASVNPPDRFFIMELCETSLHDVLHVRRESLTSSDCYQAAIDIASAVEYLHSLTPAIIHRDLKTQNVLRAKNGSYKLCDFGLVRNRSQDAGTPQYMAPEMFLARPCTKAVDVYATGVIIWEIFTAQQPHFRSSLNEIKTRVQEGRKLQFVGYNNPRLVQLANDCWEKVPTDRPTIGYVVDELLELEKIVASKKNLDFNDFGDSVDSILNHK